MVQQRWTGKSRGNPLGYKIVIAVIRTLGVRSAYALLPLIVPYFVFLGGNARKAIHWYFRHIHHYSNLRAFSATFQLNFVFAQTLIDRFALREGIDKGFHFEYEGYDSFLKLLDSGPCFIFGAHIGCWEVGAPYFNGYGNRMNIVLLDADYQKLKELVNNGSHNFYKVIPITPDGLETIMNIKAAIDRREYVNLQGDRFLEGHDAFDANFMGQPAKFPAGLFKVAAMLNVPVVFYFSMREPHQTYRFSFEIPVINGKNTNERFGQITTAYIEALEKKVRQYPTQWFNFYKFWN